MTKLLKGNQYVTGIVFLISSFLYLGLAGGEGLFYFRIDVIDIRDLPNDGVDYWRKKAVLFLGSKLYSPFPQLDCG